MKQVYKYTATSPSCMLQSMSMQCDLQTGIAVAVAVLYLGDAAGTDSVL
jgi:hypothetical protein